MCLKQAAELEKELCEAPLDNELYIKGEKKRFPGFVYKAADRQKRSARIQRTAIKPWTPAPRSLTPAHRIFTRHVIKRARQEVLKEAESRLLWCWARDRYA